MQSRRTGKLPNNSYTTTILFSPEVGLQPKDFDTWKKKMLSRYVKLYEDFAWSVEWKPCVTLLPWWHTETVCWWQQTTPTPLPLLKPDVMHNYTFFMPSSETWEKAFFVPINHLVVINDKSGHFPLSFMNDENQLGTVVWKLVMCLRFITPSHFTVFSLRSNFLFRHANQVYTKVKFVQWTKNSKKSSKFKFLILIFDTQNVYFSFLRFARSQQFSIHLKGFENLVKKKDNFHICQGCNQGFGIKRSSINGF